MDAAIYFWQVRFYVRPKTKYSLQYLEKIATNNTQCYVCLSIKMFINVYHKSLAMRLLMCEVTTHKQMNC